MLWILNVIAGIWFGVVYRRPAAEVRTMARRGAMVVIVSNVLAVVSYPLAWWWNAANIPAADLAQPMHSIVPVPASVYIIGIIVTVFGLVAAGYGVYGVFKLHRVRLATREAD
jgi:hypothetical protein